MRTYKTIYDALDEVMRDLMVRGISVESKSYQDKKLEGKDRIIKELIGVSFAIDKPSMEKDKSIKLLFPTEYNKILKYCKQEVKDRCSGKQLNPGNSYKIREDMWNKFIEGDNKFSYTYSERLNKNKQFQNVINALKEDKGTRQAVLSMWDPNLDMDPKKLGGGNRIPCSLFYQFLIRNDRLHCMYHMRSNSFFEHCVIDLYTTTGMMEYMVKELKKDYPNLKMGQLMYSAGSLHAFQWNLKEWNSAVF